ncbi:hypothetical protein PSD2002_0171 [Escherichia phage PSD2002]|nr:hypothetical protein PSD2002_0171 [Escherichia phage PSD2002]
MKTYNEFVQTEAINEVAIPKPAKADGTEYYHIETSFDAASDMANGLGDFIRQAKSDLAKFTKTLDKEQKKPFSDLAKKLDALNDKVFKEVYHGMIGLTREFNAEVKKLP